MGLFSSDEDLTSGVPRDAGGYLSKYLPRALEGDTRDLSMAELVVQ